MGKNAVIVVALFAVAWFLYQHHGGQYSGGRFEDPSLKDPAGYLRRSAPQFELHYDRNHTYAGMVMAGADARTVQANTTSYCIEAGGFHLAGPGGEVERGRCPGPGRR